MMPQNPPISPSFCWPTPNKANSIKPINENVYVPLKAIIEYAFIVVGLIIPLISVLPSMTTFHASDPKERHLIPLLMILLAQMLMPQVQLHLVLSILVFSGAISKSSWFDTS